MDFCVLEFAPKIINKILKMQYCYMYIIKNEKDGVDIILIPDDDYSGSNICLIYAVNFIKCSENFNLCMKCDDF